MTLQTLGGLHFHTFRRVKPLLLAAYLAVEGPTARRALAELLWPQARQPDSSLRVALHALREAAGAAVHGDDPLAWTGPCDALTLLSARGLAALHTYPGPFLHGADLSGTLPEFEDWVLAQRERLALHVQLETLRAAAGLDPGAAAHHAELAYRLPGAAAATPDLLRQALALTLPGSALEAELRAELADLTGPDGERRDGGHVSAGGRLLGRAAEVGRLLAWAADPQAAPAAQITGPPGIGKSALGREVLREWHALGRPVTHLSAQGLHHPSEVQEGLAGAHGGPGGWADLRAALAPGTLVLLDGPDDLPDLGRWLTAAAAQLPGVRWLVSTRRPRPDAPAALTLHLGGLPCPAPDATEPELHASPAAALFMREAARVRRDLNFSGPDAALLSGIVRRLEGHPLALTLAASWLGREGLADVHARILREAGLGAGADGDRGLLLAARPAWALLGGPEREAALKLSVFADLDPHDAAQLGIPDAALDALLARAFLEAYRPGSDRLRVPAALTPFLREVAAAHPALIRAAERDHARHYLTRLGGGAPTRPEVAADLGNIVRALHAAISSGEVTPALMNQLMAHYLGRGTAESGTDVFQQLSDALEDAGAPADTQATAAICTMWLAQSAERLLDAQTLAGRFLQGPLADDPGHRMRALNTLAVIRQKQGRTRVAAGLLEQALALAQALNDPGREQMYLMNLLIALVKVGDAARVTELLPRAAPLFGPGAPLQVRVKNLWLNLHVTAPDHAGIVQQAAALLEEARAAHDLDHQAQILVFQGMALLAQGEARRAQAQFQAARQLAEQAESPEWVINALTMETEALYALGRTPQARACAAQAVDRILAQPSFENLVEVLQRVASDLTARHPEAFGTLVAAVCRDERLDHGTARTLVTHQRPGVEAGPPRTEAALLADLRHLLG